MPYTGTTPSLPFQGSEPIARECSRQAAIAKAPRFGAKSFVYLKWLDRVGHATDAGAAEGLDLPLQSICSIRNALIARGYVRSIGKQVGQYGLSVTVYELTAVGRLVARDQMPIRPVRIVGAGATRGPRSFDQEMSGSSPGWRPGQARTQRSGHPTYECRSCPDAARP